MSESGPRGSEISSDTRELLDIPEQVLIVILSEQTSKVGRLWTG